VRGPPKVFREQARKGELIESQKQQKEKLNYEKSKYGSDSDPVGVGLLCVFTRNARSGTGGAGYRLNRR
jgi:hypothetical protein